MSRKVNRLPQTVLQTPLSFIPAETQSWDSNIYWEALYHYLLSGDTRTLLLIAAVQNRRQAKTRWIRGQQEKKMHTEVKWHTHVHTRNSSKIRIGFQDFWNSTQNCAIRGYFGLLSWEVGEDKSSSPLSPKSIMCVWVICIKWKNWSVELCSQKSVFVQSKKTNSKSNFSSIPPWYSLH